MYDEMDILREVGSMSAAHGSIALSEILGRKIILNLPSVDIINCAEVSQRITPGQIGIAVYAKITGIDGELAFILDEKSAFKLVDLCYKISPEDKKSGVLTEIGMSFIKEVGNIVIGYYVGALSTILKKLIMHLIPTLMSGPMEQILNGILMPYKSEDYVVLMEAVFQDPEENIKGSYYFILTPKAASNIQQVCKKTLDELEKKPS